jgi:hypothetical protein
LFEESGRADKIETPEGEGYFCLKVAREETYDITYEEGEGEGRNCWN